MLGNESVGKTTLIQTFLNRTRVNAIDEPLGYKYWYPPQNKFGNQKYRAYISLDGEEIILEICERKHTVERYPSKVVIVLCSVVDRTSWKNIKQLSEEIRLGNRRIGLETAIILVGSKTDLRKEQNVFQFLSRRKEQPIPTSMGEKLASEILAIKYLECSCFNREDVEKVFEEVVWASLRFAKSSIPKLTIVVDGKDYVGKTSIICQFETGKPCYQPKCTIGTTMTPKSIIVDQCEYLLEIVEFNSLEISRAMRKTKAFQSYLSTANAFIVVFSLTDPDSFNFVTERCIPDINDHSPFMPKVLVGSFADQRYANSNQGSNQSCITTEMGKQLAHQINAAINVLRMFTYIRKGDKPCICGGS